MIARVDDSGSVRDELLDELVALTEDDSDPRLATVAEHLVRAIESITLATRTAPQDDEITQRGLKHAWLETRAIARSVRAVHLSARRRAAK